MHRPAVRHPAVRTAVGVLNLGVSESPAVDRHVLDELARVHGYRLVDVLTVDEDTYLPTAYIAERARTVGATALLAPGLEHFGVSARVLPLIAELIVPGVSGPDTEPDHPGATKASWRQRHRMRRAILAVLVLAALLISTWALWPAPDPAPQFERAPTTSAGRHRILRADTAVHRENRSVGDGSFGVPLPWNEKAAL